MSTAGAFRVPYNLSDPIGNTHYDEQFYPKIVQKEEVIRAGTASGSRANKPHPTNVKMII
jgi:hypothetical protein